MRRNDNVYKRNLRIVIVETLLTSIGAGFCVPTITIFYNSIGMDQTAIGFVQMAFTIMICCLDIPMGYIADRFDRKVLNVIGDIGAALSFMLYTFAQNVYCVLASECMLGISLAMTNGVDQSFIKHNCDKIDETGMLFKRVNVKVHTARYVALFVVAILGGLIAKINIRLSICVSAIPYLVGGIFAMFVKDFGDKVEAKHTSIIRDMVSTVREILKNKKTKNYLISYILGKEITHSQIWVLTPLLILVGVPVEIVSLGWILNNVMQILGGKISEKMSTFKVSRKFAVPVLIELSWMIILIIRTNIVTIWLFALNGLVHGLLEGNFVTVVQESAKDTVQTSVISVASTGARLLYIPLVFFINYLGNIQLQYALVGVCTVFAPLCLIMFLKLREMEVK